MSLTFEPQKRLEEIDYSAPDEVKKAVNTIKKKTRLEHSEVIKGLYSNNLDYLKNNHHLIHDEFRFFSPEETRDILRPIPQETLDNFKTQLEESLMNDRKYISEVDELDQSDRYLEMQGYISSQRNLIREIDTISDKRFEDKLELAQKLGIQNGNHYDLLDPLKKFFYEKAYGLDYDYVQNKDGSYTLDIQQNGNPFMTAELTHDNKVKSITTPFDGVENGPSPENDFNQENKKRKQKRNTLTM